jgi:membrane fusion protein (multidrug efflux system)
LVLGRDVAEGDVLVELDAVSLRLSADEERARQAALGSRRAALRSQMEAAREVVMQQREVLRDRLEESTASERQAKNAAELAEQEMRRSTTLNAEGVTSAAEALRARTDAAQRRAAKDGARLATRRLASEARAAETDRQASLARLEEELSDLEGQTAMSLATLARLEHEVELRILRAPIAGRIGEASPLYAGAVVKEADRLGSIIPNGKLHIVAEYLPSSVGRIRPGQSARMRPDGFPWTQYGTLAATVKRVSNEPRSGLIRVELEVLSPTHPLIPMQHGMPGTLEVEVDSASPAAIALRASGQWLSEPARSQATE